MCQKQSSKTFSWIKEITKFHHNFHIFIKLLCEIWLFLVFFSVRSDCETKEAQEAFRFKRKLCFLEEKCEMESMTMLGFLSKKTRKNGEK